MFKEVFLIVLGILWIGFAMLEDFKKREIANWLTSSLIIFAIGFRLFYSLFYGDVSGEGFSFLYQGLLGLGAFFIIGNLFYYARIFAGGDAKLMISLGAILPFSLNYLQNISLSVSFLIMFLLWGAIYGIGWSFYLALKNRKGFKKEFSRRFHKDKMLFYLSSSAGIVLLILSFFEVSFLAFALFVFLLPYLYVVAKSIDESSMVKEIKPSELTEGDWLYRDVKIGNKVIKSSWEGLSNKEISLLKKRLRKVKIRYGIPYAPVFFLSFLSLVILWVKGLGGWIFF